MKGKVCELLLSIICVVLAIYGSIAIVGEAKKAVDFNDYSVLVALELALIALVVFCVRFMFSKR